tara:strand:+ start:1479 stop:2396 length:918 start_codon:yes stop_codon:yes gene_type:complete
MRDVNCYICNSSNHEKLFKQQGNDTYIKFVFDVEPENLWWKICLDCGLVYRSPVLDEHEINILYSNYDKTIFKNTDPNMYFQKIINIPNNESENYQKVLWLSDNLDTNDLSSKEYKALDIGCGGGTLLYTLKTFYQNILLHGVELNETYSSIARKNLNIDLKNVNYESGLFDYKFDLLINTKVLEHIIDPLPFLKIMASDLNESGNLFIEVPDISDMYNLPKNDERFFIPHIYFFSKETLSFLLEKSGFEIVKNRVFTSQRNRSYLQIIAKKSKNQINSNFLLESKKNISNIISKIKRNIDHSSN